MKRGRNQVVRHVLVGKIDARLDQRQRLDQPAPPGVRAAAERAGKLAHRLRALRLGLGEHEVAKPLDGGEIEPPVGKRAARELARLRGPEARQLARARPSTAATTARPPCRCSSAMSSAVSVFGPGNQSTSASSSSVSPSRSRRSAARRGSGSLPPSAVIASPARGPETRTTAIAAGGRPEERAKMVGVSVLTRERWRDCNCG